jgi:hypothetical protein
MNKYGNTRTAHADGTVSASKKEGRRYAELKILSDAGLIRFLKTQQTYELIPKQVGERPCSYVADFTYIDHEGIFHCEDTKGFRTKDYIIKRKLMLFRLGIKIEEI